MYDYISIRSDNKYTEKIKVSHFVSLIKSKFSFFNQEGNATFSYMLGKYKILINGIHADASGNYAFNSDSEFTEINLIEVNIPHGSENEFETEILNITKQISKELNWEAKDHESGDILYSKA